MSKPESAASQASIKDILQRRRRRGKEADDVVPTEIAGVFLRAEAGKKPDILQKTIGQFAVLGAKFAAGKAALNALAEQQKEPEQAIKAIVQAHEGLRGIQSEPDNFKISVIPRYSINWDPRRLKESLGIAHSSVVREDLNVSFSIPLGYKTKKGPLDSELLQAALVKGLVGLGLPEDEVGTIVDPRVVPRVDEAKLADLLADGRVSLLEGTGEVAETWAITVDQLKKP